MLAGTTASSRVQQHRRRYKYRAPTKAAPIHFHNRSCTIHCNTIRKPANISPHPPAPQETRGRRKARAEPPESRRATSPRAELRARRTRRRVKLEQGKSACAKILIRIEETQPNRRLEPLSGGATRQAPAQAAGGREYPESRRVKIREEVLKYNKYREKGERGEQGDGD